MAEQGAAERRVTEHRAGEPRDIWPGRVRVSGTRVEEAKQAERIERSTAIEQFKALLDLPTRDQDHAEALQRGIVLWVEFECQPKLLLCLVKLVVG